MRFQSAEMAAAVLAGLDPPGTITIGDYSSKVELLVGDEETAFLSQVGCPTS